MYFMDADVFTIIVEMFFCHCIHLCSTLDANYWKVHMDRKHVVVFTLLDACDILKHLQMNCIQF